jgi:glycosyltransferase involved in cell wall biosynthesis
MVAVLGSPTADHTARAAQPLRVAVYLADQNPHRDRSLGITSMTGTLLEGLAARGDLALTQVVSKSSYRQPGESIETCLMPCRTDKSLRRLLVDACHPWLARPNVDLWYYPKGYVSPLALPSVPSVGTMHDAIVQHYADHYPGTRNAFAFRYWIEVTKRSLRRLTCVLTISQHAASQLLDFCDRHGVNPPAIHITYESSAWESQRGKTRDKTDCVTHLASPAPHKKSLRLLEMWAELQQRGRELPELDLIGELDPQAARVCQQLRGVRRLKMQSTSDLQTLLARSRALLLPSEIEGFGLPALEAYYVGTPVCFVNKTAVSEVVQGAGQRGGFELADVDSFEQALDWALNAPRSLVCEIGDAMYDMFRLTKTTDRILTAFRDVAGR